jgi:polygalacturonase
LFRPPGWGCLFPAAVAGIIGAAATVSATTVSIADRGAVADGRSMDTRAIQSAVDECAAQGGGTVVVPAGIWLTGSVALKSQVSLRLEAGAILRASGNLADYPTNGFKHRELGETRSLLWAIGQTNVSIGGEGTIELSDRPFFDWDKLRTGLPPEKEAQLADWQRRQCVVTALDRPTLLIFFHGCQGVRLEGVAVKNSPCWTITFSCSENIQVRGLRIDNNLQVPNNDGLHFCGSKNIVVSDCIIDGGDDALAFTGITDPASLCENIAVANCVLRSRSCGIHIGYSSGKVRNVAINNLVIRDSSRGFAIQAGEGGWVEDVLINNVVLDTRMFAGAWWGKGEPLIISAANSTGRIHGVTVSHLRGQADNSILVVGQDKNVSDIIIDDVELGIGKSANAALYGGELDLAPAPARPSRMAQDWIPWIYAESVAGLELRHTAVHPRDIGGRKLKLDPVLKDVSRRHGP